MEKTSQISTTDSKPQKLYSSITPAKAKKLAQELNKFLSNNGLVMEIANKKYVPVEGWEFLGTQMGLTQIITKCEPVMPTEDIKEIKYRAEVEIINQHGTIVSRGFAWCSNKESKKKLFEEYAIASMAQTRAIGKAYRNILSWIVKMGGYEATPYEEVDKDKMETDLAKAKQKIYKLFQDNGLKDSTKMMDYLAEVLNKRSIDTIDDANKVIGSFSDN